MTETYAERRAAMAGETRTRILEACVQILGRGVTELSIPAVARAAGVSVPTVYRNFPDKRTLVHETALYLKRLRGNFPPVASVSELPAQIRRNFEQQASVNETVRTALLSEPILAARRDLGERDRRATAMANLFETELAEWPAEDRRRFIDVATVLCSSATLRAFRDVIDATPEQAADTVSWVLARLLGRDSLEGEARPANGKTMAKGKRR